MQIAKMPARKNPFIHHLFSSRTKICSNYFGCRRKSKRAGMTNWRIDCNSNSIVMQSVAEKPRLYMFGNGSGAWYSTDRWHTYTGGTAKRTGYFGLYLALSKIRLAGVCKICCTVKSFSFSSNFCRIRMPIHGPILPGAPSPVLPCGRVEVKGASPM